MRHGAAIFAKKELVYGPNLTFVSKHQHYISKDNEHICQLAMFVKPHQ